MRAHVFAHCCLVMCVPASHIFMHSALLSSTALLRVAVSGAAGRAAGGAGAMEPVWAATATVLKTSIIDIIGMRMAIPREAVVSPPSGDGGTRAIPSCASQRRRRLYGAASGAIDGGSGLC